MARVGFDMDGVLYDFEDALRDYMTEQGYLNPMPVATQWQFGEQWGLTDLEFKAWCEEALLEGNLFDRDKQFPGAIEQLQRVRDAGHEIILITARNFGHMNTVKRQTIDWLERYGVPYDELHFLPGRRKAEVQVDYFIDDNVDNFKRMNAAAVRSFLCTRPYNEDCVALGYGYRGSLADYVDKVLAQVAQEKRYNERLVKTPSPDEVRVTSSTGGQKGKKLARFDLIPPRALWQVAELYGKGAEKYEDWNWRKGYPWSLSIAALERHLSLFKQGEEYDSETGCAHLASVVFHALALLTFMDEHRQFDDRFQAARSEGLDPKGGTGARPIPVSPSEGPSSASGGHVCAPPKCPMCTVIGTLQN